MTSIEAGPRSGSGLWQHPGTFVPPPGQSVRRSKDLFAEDVGVAGVLRQLTQHLQLQRPDPAVTTAVDDRVEAQGSHRAPRPFTSPAMGGLHRSDRVVLGQREGLGRGGGDADLGVRAAADRLVEPDAFDVRDMLDQTEQRRPRRDQPKSGFLLGETVEGVVERRPILVQEFIETRAKVRGPRIARFGRCSDRPSTLPTSSRRSSIRSCCAGILLAQPVPAVRSRPASS